MMADSYNTSRRPIAYATPPSMLNYAVYAVLAMNLITFAAFGIDKWKARRDRWRIPESTLLGLSWATGFIGGWIAMSVFRHKSSKTSFRVKMAAVSIFNLLWVVVYWAIQQGAAN